MIPKLLLAVVAGVVAFLVSSLSHQFSRGFEDGVLVCPDGTAATIVGSGWGWLAGAAIFVIAVAAAALARRVRWIAWLAFGATVLALAIAGSVIRVLVPASDPTPPSVPLLWLIDGAAEPLTWAIAGVAVVLAVTRRRPARPTVGRLPAVSLCSSMEEQFRPKERVGGSSPSRGTADRQSFVSSWASMTRIPLGPRRYVSL